MLARAFDLRSVTPATSSQASVALVIQTSPDLVPLTLADLARHGDRASFAYTGQWSADALGSLERSGNEVLPALGSGSLTGWVHTRGTLAKEATSLGFARPGVYLPPRDGFTLGQYLLARTRGALPVSGAVTLDPRLSRSRMAVKQGEVLVLDLSSSSSTSLQFLDEVLTALKAGRPYWRCPSQPQPARLLRPIHEQRPWSPSGEPTDRRRAHINGD